MRKIKLTTLLIIALVFRMNSQTNIYLHVDQAKTKINKEIYGQFAEHLGNCIYGGIWVGEHSDIPNINGYRTDVLQALKELHIPVLRWPGGCFADEYHWMDGIGPTDKRPKMVNTNWGGVTEDNSFGTNEFLNLCEMLGCEPYISGNVGSGTVKELAQWIEYMTSDSDNPMAQLRRQNGREKPWKVKYIGVGNESWGCGGNMTPDYYSDLFRRYSTYCREYDGNHLFKIASGASDYDYNWTETLMKDVGTRMNGLSLHYYTVKGWNGSKGSATDFDLQDYYWTMEKCLEIKDVIKKHMAIMDKYDPHKNVGLMVDEWGTWWDQEPGTHPGFLYQQNTLRDAFVAALTLNIFNEYTERIKMANIAQVVNVLQAMILTKGDKMVLTPTYYVFDMYKVHQDALNIPIDIQCDSVNAGNHKIPSVSVSASKDGKGIIHVTIANILPDKKQRTIISLPVEMKGQPKGTILTADKINSFNSFDQPNSVVPVSFNKMVKKDKQLIIDLPAKSILAIEISL